MDWTLPAAFGSLIATDHGYSQGSDDNWYFISPDTKDWYSAKAACLTTSGSRLAVPKSRPEYDQIISLKCKNGDFMGGMSVLLFTRANI